MNKEKIHKIKINLVLLLINLLKKIGNFIFWFSEKIIQGFFLFFLLILKFFLFLFASFYLKIKKLIKNILSSFHYQSGIFSFFSGKRLGIIFLIFIFLFIISEQKIVPEEKLVIAASSIINQENPSKKPDFQMAVTKEEEEAVLRQSLIFDEKFVPTRTEIEKYIVQPGDTISSIAEDFDVSINTILWENKLTPRSIIKPGQVLKILPVSGVSHIVKKGETIEKIARYYRANKEDIINFNDLEEEPLKVGDLIIIPEGKIPPPEVPKNVSKIVKDKIWPIELEKRTREGTNCRNFYPGQCTWYVAQRYCIPWSGHAKNWLANAKKMGYLTGLTPKVGAIISLKETWYGHVAIVEEIKENSIIISEMNHLGPWKVNRREIKINDWRINGYIYMD